MLLLSLGFLTGLNHVDFMDIEKISPSWDQNPFVQYQMATRLEDLSLLAVLYDAHEPDKSAALINEYVVQVGDKVGTFEVVSISRVAVLVRGESGVFEIGFKKGRK